MDLFTWMDELHTIHKIQDDLDHRDREIFMKMMYAAEHNMLTKFINDTGYGEVFRILSR